MTPQSSVVVLLRRDDEILLAMKRRGFGKGLWNGAGGKPEPGETLKQAAVRECQEEINVTPLKLQQFAQLRFVNQHDDIEVWDSAVYVCREWEGEPAESEEMTPQWFALGDIPYDTMWADDAYWLPPVLAGKYVDGEFEFDKQNNLIAHSLTVRTS